MDILRDANASAFITLLTSIQTVLFVTTYISFTNRLLRKFAHVYHSLTVDREKKFKEVLNFR